MAAVTSSLDALPVSDPVRRQFDFLLASHRLTGVLRLNRLLDGSRSESSAEHSWHLALMAIVLAADHAPDVDLGRVVSMLVIHDLVEVEAGDVPIYDEQLRTDIVAEEQRAAAALFGRLPPEEGSRLLALWQEFEAAGTDAARFARAIDRLQPLLLHWASDGAAWAARGVTVAVERRLMAAIEGFWPSLGPIADGLVADAHRRGLLAD
jgi:putative hydrolase of HD superfamily